MPTRAPRRGLLAVLLTAAIVLSGCAAGTSPRPVELASDAGDGITVTVHRTESCSCCGEYEDYLEGLGFEVEQVLYDDLSEVKERFGVPRDQGSCHTNEVGGYAAEGHVPAEALLELLAEKPEIDGIALAGMPSGSPGMPGEQTEPFVVNSFKDGAVVGEFGRY